MLKYDCNKSIVYTILVFDWSDCCFADVYSDGEIKIIFEEASQITNFKKAGGQSAQRYERNRQLEITKWFKSINDKLMHENREFYIGCSSVYYDRFHESLHTYNKKKIIEQVNNCYANRAGIYEMLNILNSRRR